jgi:hypothetical protein
MQRVNCIARRLSKLSAKHKYNEKQIVSPRDNHSQLKTSRQMPHAAAFATPNQNRR